jgi:PRC-barrel domain
LAISAAAILVAMTPSPTVIPGIVVEDIKEWRGQDVLDPDGEKLGKLEEIYYDAESDTPAFAAVKSGTFGKHITLVPLASATAGHDFVRVGTGKDRFKQAPSFDTDAELSADDETGAYGYYGLDYRPLGGGARRLAKH